jgi:hypothetical protein
MNRTLNRTTKNGRKILAWILQEKKLARILHGSGLARILQEKKLAWFLHMQVVCQKGWHGNCNSKKRAKKLGMKVAIYTLYKALRKTCWHGNCIMQSVCQALRKRKNHAKPEQAQNFFFCNKNTHLHITLKMQANGTVFALEKREKTEIFKSFFCKHNKRLHIKMKKNEKKRKKSLQSEIFYVKYI